MGNHGETLFVKRHTKGHRVLNVHGPVSIVELDGERYVVEERARGRSQEICDTDVTDGNRRAMDHAVGSDKDGGSGAT